MNCTRCRHANGAAAKPCENREASFTRNCANCGLKFSATANFSPLCEQPTAAPFPLAGRFGSFETYSPRHLAE